VPTNGAEKTGYPTQKPEGVLRRIVQASTRPGDWCLDFFAGSGTLGAVAAKLGRRYVLIDSNPEAVRVMRARLGRPAAAVANSLSGGAGETVKAARG
jgi:site-specific DNA-methyltransferase (adenine-specific)